MNRNVPNYENNTFISIEMFLFVNGNVPNFEEVYLFSKKIRILQIKCSQFLENVPFYE